MEPTFRTEPTLGKFAFDQQATPAPAVAPNPPKPESATPSRASDASDLIASLSKDLQELSKPAGQTAPEPDEEDDEYEQEEQTVERNASSAVFRSITLLVCLLAVVVAAWQVCLFLQPAFLRQEPLRAISSTSCQYLICPAVREPRILSSEVRATGPDEWDLLLQVQNPDMRAQKLPAIELTLENASSATARQVIDASGYKVTPEVKELEGGQTVKIRAPFRYSDGRPTHFTAKVIADK